MRRSGCPCGHRQKEKAFLKSMRNHLRDQPHVLRRAAGKCPTGISPLANIPSPCAWKASFPLFGRGMRTQAPASRRLPDSARGIGKKRNSTSCDVRQGSILREFRRWRIYPRPAPGKRAFRSSGGVCEPKRLQADASPIPRAESAKKETARRKTCGREVSYGNFAVGKGNQ